MDICLINEAKYHPYILAIENIEKSFHQHQQAFVFYLDINFIRTGIEQMKKFTNSNRKILNKLLVKEQTYSDLSQKYALQNYVFSPR